MPQTSGIIQYELGLKNDVICKIFHWVAQVMIRINGVIYVFKFGMKSVLL